MRQANTRLCDASDIAKVLWLKRETSEKATFDFMGIANEKHSGILQKKHRAFLGDFVD